MLILFFSFSSFFSSFFSSLFSALSFRRRSKLSPEACAEKPNANARRAARQQMRNAKMCENQHDTFGEFRSLRYPQKIRLALRASRVSSSACTLVIVSLPAESESCSRRFLNFHGKPAHSCDVCTAFFSDPSVRILRYASFGMHPSAHSLGYASLRTRPISRETGYLFSSASFMGGRENTTVGFFTRKLVCGAGKSSLKRSRTRIVRELRARNCACTKKRGKQQR